MQPIDEARLNEFLGKAVSDFGATLSAAMVVLGDKLGLYKTLAGAGPLSATELAGRTGTSVRYVRPWLINQAAGGYVEYDAATDTYRLTPEQAAALADEDSPACVLGAFQVFTSALKAEPRIAEAFRTGGGLTWGEHDPGLFEGTERFFRPGYAANLVSSWIPALDGVAAKLTKGAMVADVGCGHGASTIILAQAFPTSRFFGFDNHAPSIERAREAAIKAGVADRVRFEVAGAAGYPGAGYDLIAYFDCLHDMGDPVGAARHARETIAPDGTVLLVEPMAGATVAENLNPVGRIFSAASVLICTPNALAGEGHGLGTIATDEELREVLAAGGFTRFRRATETPFNRVFEARP
ncbi:MAG: class I SAM-dependent methyltransferase [Dehalococcoidia bacterium]